MDRREGGKDTTNEHIMNTSAWLFAIYISLHIFQNCDLGVSRTKYVYLSSNALSNPHFQSEIY